MGGLAFPVKNIYNKNIKPQNKLSVFFFFLLNYFPLTKQYFGRIDFKVPRQIAKSQKEKIFFFFKLCSFLRRELNLFTEKRKVYTL